MAASPKFKVYRGAEYIAAIKYGEDAAAFVAIIGDGATVRLGHNFVLWTEGQEHISAAESYDEAAAVMHGREADFRETNFKKVYGFIKPAAVLT